MEPSIFWRAPFTLLQQHSQTVIAAIISSLVCVTALLDLAHVTAITEERYNLIKIGYLWNNMELADKS